MNGFLFRMRAAFGKRIGSRLIQVLLSLKTDYRFAELYGDFHFGRSFDRKAIKGLAQESGKIYGGLVKFLIELPAAPETLFLPGENNAVRSVYAKLLGIPPERITTAGILDGMDVYWNFEEPPPQVGPFDCILSQSMLEHLVDPYKHVRELSSLLRPGGHLLIHTVMPGFHYHRHPVDCMRFYPDWFEEIARRLELAVVDKYIHNARITYKYRKPGGV